MSTDSKKPTKNNPTLLFKGDEPSKKDDLIESLQKSLSHEIDGRREERFIWMMALMVMFDTFTFSSMQTWSGPFMIGLIQLIILIALGRRWQMDHIWTLTEKLVDKWDGSFKGK